MLKRHEIALQLQGKSGYSSSPRMPELSALSSLERVALLSELENKNQIELDEDSFVSDNLFSSTFGQPNLFVNPRRAMVGVRLNLGR